MLYPFKDNQSIKQINRLEQDDDYEDIKEPELKAELRNGSTLIDYSEKVS